MGQTTLRELFKAGLITKDEYWVFKSKQEKPVAKIRYRLSPRPSAIDTKNLSTYINIAQCGNGCLCSQQRLKFGSNRKQAITQRPVLIASYRKGPRVAAFPLTTKKNSKQTFFLLNKEDWLCLKDFSRYEKDGYASPNYETVPLNEIEYFGHLSPNKTKELQHWFDQLENTNHGGN